MNNRSFHIRFAASLAIIVSCGASRVLAQDAVDDAPQPLPVWGLAFSPDGTLLASAASDRAENGVVTVRKTADWSTAFSLNQLGAPTCVAFSPDGARLLIGTQSGEVLLADVGKGRVDRRWGTGQPGVNGLTWTPNGEQLLTAGSHGAIKVWDAAAGELQRTLDTWAADGLTDPSTQPQDTERQPQQRFIWDVAVSPDGRTVVSGGWMDTTRLWDLSTGNMLMSFAGTDELVQGVVFTPDGLHFAASALRKGEVIVRETQTGVESARFRASSRDIAIHPGGELLAAASSSGVQVFRMKLAIPTDADVERYQQIIAKFEDDDVNVREAASAEVLEIGPPIAPLLFEAIQAPGAETRMRSRRLWNQLREQPAIAELTGLDGELRQVTFSPDGNLLAASSKGGDVRVWSVPEFELQQAWTVRNDR